MHAPGCMLGAFNYCSPFSFLATHRCNLHSGVTKVPNFKTATLKVQHLTCKWSFANLKTFKCFKFTFDTLNNILQVLKINITSTSSSRHSQFNKAQFNSYRRTHFRISLFAVSKRLEQVCNLVISHFWSINRPRTVWLPFWIAPYREIVKMAARN